MKKSTLITILGVFVASLAIAQSEETRSLSSFSEVSAQEAIKVYLRSGNKEEARIEAENIDIADVLTEVSGDRLKIHLEGSNHRNVDVKVYVTYKSISALKSSSASAIIAEDAVEASGDFDVDVSSSGYIKATISAEELTIDASSAGDIKLNVDVKEIDAEASSSADIEVEGTATFQKVQVSSAGEYNAYDVKSEKVDVSASSGGSIKVDVSERIDARASSGGSVRYNGSPKYVDVNSCSGGSVRKS